MAITGGIKFFGQNQALFANGASGTASSGTGSESNALDRNKFTFWISVGSNDATQETYTLTLPSSVSFNRIFLIDHNFKQFEVDYDDGGFTSFTNVSGLDGSVAGGIVETTFADSTAYYEFNTVTTDTIRIRIDKTQIADEQKRLNKIIVCTELGTLEGFPEVRAVKTSRNSRVQKMLSGKFLIQKSLDSRQFELKFGSYPSGLQSDLDLMVDLFDREDDFLVWLCGGRRGNDFYRYTLPGYKLEDVIPMQVDRDVSFGYRDNVYINPVNLSVSLVEHV